MTNEETIINDDDGQVVVLSNSEIECWREHFEKVESGVYHDPRYVDFIAGHLDYEDEKPEAFVYQRDGETIYYPYLRRPLTTLQFESTVPLDGYSDIVSSWYWGGPLSTSGVKPDMYRSFFEIFEDYTTQQNIVSEFIRFDPNLKNYENCDALDPVLHGETVWVDLDQSPEDIWEEYEDRNQRAIRQAQESNLSVEPATAIEEVEAFADVYQSRMDEMGASDHYRFSTEFFHGVYDRSSMFSVLVARDTTTGDIVGGFVIAHDDQVGHHFLSASYTDYWDDRINNLLYHEAVLTTRDRDCFRFDFQGGREGVFNFKKGFSPHRGEFYIAKQIHLGTPYEQLCSEAAEHGLAADDDYFPAYRTSQS